jgi:hypothetical protein
MAWQEATKTREETTERERLLRKEAIACTFGRLERGTRHYTLGQGWSLKATNYWKYDITRNAAGGYENLPQYLAQLPESIANRLIKWKAELNTSVYEELTQEQKIIVNNFLTIKDGSPSLELVYNKPV